jgi:hypothetical protein
MKRVDQNESKNLDRDIYLFVLTLITGIVCGASAHLATNDLIDDTVHNEGHNRLLRYMVGVMAMLPCYLVARHAQHEQHKEKPPISRQAGDFLGVASAVGCGVVIPRLWHWLID